RVNVRLVAATHRDLTEMVRRGKFRSDLYYRLNVFPIMLPPLRERRQDIPELVSHFVEVFSRRMGKQIVDIPKAVLDGFISYSWPGNVRELQNLLERAVIRSEDGVLSNPLVGSEDSLTLALGQGTFIDSQRAVILQALEETDWVVGGAFGAAARLGMPRTSLISKMRKLGISRSLRQNDVDQLQNGEGGSVVDEKAD